MGHAKAPDDCQSSLQQATMSRQALASTNVARSPPELDSTLGKHDVHPEEVTKATTISKKSKSSLRAPPAVLQISTQQTVNAGLWSYTGAPAKAGNNRRQTSHNKVKKITRQRQRDRMRGLTLKRLP